MLTYVYPVYPHRINIDKEVRIFGVNVNNTNRWLVQNAAASKNKIFIFCSLIEAQNHRHHDVAHHQINLSFWLSMQYK